MAEDDPCERQQKYQTNLELKSILELNSLTLLTCENNLQFDSQVSMRIEKEIVELW